MSLLFLTNQAGHSANTLDNEGSNSTATGYSRSDVISGPRSTCHRGAIYAGATGLAYHFSADVNLDYCVVARADWLLTANTSRVLLKEKSSGAVWSFVAGVDYNPLTSASLIGIRSQDLVIPFTQTQKRGIQLLTNPISGSDSQQISKFYGCSSFGFSSPPELNFTQSEFPIGTYQVPPNSTRPYEVELGFTLSFFALSRAEVSSFKTLPQLRNWPVFLYDTAGDIWTHKLEHVIITGWSEVIVENNVHNLQIGFSRLRHYE